MITEHHTLTLYPKDYKEAIILLNKYVDKGWRLVTFEESVSYYILTFNRIEN